jgi:branched-chain amino acid transport system permease protein
MSELARERQATGSLDLASLAKRYAPWIATALLFLVLPRIFDSGTALTTMSLMGIMIVFALSYNMLLGQTGMLSFGHAVYYGLGAFCAIHAMNVVVRNDLPIPLIFIPLVGGLGGLFFGVLFGSVTTRRSGTAFAMISLGLAELVASSSLILRTFFGGEEGITTNRTKLFRIFDWNFGPQVQVYYLIAAWCFICIVAMYALTRTPFGRMCNAVRDNPERAEFVGYNPTIVRLVALSLSGFFAGIAGALAVIQFELANSTYVGALQSGIVLLAAYLGGVGFFIGPALGAILVTYLQVMLSDVTPVWQLYFGLLFVGMVMFAPFGLAGLLMMHQPLWRAGVLHRLAAPYAMALIPLLLTVAGVILIIEATYRVTVGASEGTTLTLFRLSFDAARAGPWVFAVSCLAAGVLLFRFVGPRLRSAWSDALTTARAQGFAL